MLETSNQEDGVSDLITADEFATDWLGIKPQSLYARRCRQPELLPPALKIGRRLYFRRTAVMEWLDTQEQAQNTPRKKNGSR